MAYDPADQAEADDADWLYRQHELQEWKQAQHEKAPEILSMLRQHLPAERLREVEKFLSTSYGCDCLYEALRRDLSRTELRKIVPVGRWGEIEKCLDKGMFTPLSHDECERFANATRDLPPRLF
jgi:hypothetical protein